MFNNRYQNSTQYKILQNLLESKFEYPVLPPTSGGAARDGTSVWSWFWIAQGLAVVVVTAVIQSVN